MICPSHIFMRFRFFLYLSFFFTWSVCQSAPNSIKIHRIQYEGLHTTQSKVVERELYHKPGSLFSTEKWQQEKGRLEALDVFSSVQFRLDTIITPSREVEHRLTYLFQELPPYIPFINGTKTDQDGFLIGPAFLSVNFLGHDLRLEGFFRTSIHPLFKINEWQLSSHALWIGSLPVEHAFAYRYRNSENSLLHFRETSHRVNLDLFQRLTPRFHLLYKGALSYVSADSTNRNRVLLSPRGGDWVPRLGFGFRIDTRTSTLDPLSGHYLESALTQNGGILGGPAHFVEFLWDTRNYLSLTPRHTLSWNHLIRQRFGTLGAYDRLHLGGANSLRGYRFEDGLSGDSEWLSTLEYRYRWFPRIPLHVANWHFFLGLQWVAGVDFGAVWNKVPYNKSFELEVGSSYYTGFHVLIPAIDRIRLEVGSQFARFRLEWSLGLFEKATSQRWHIR
jgi:outer membrane protein assembly factor BamA